KLKTEAWMSFRPKSFGMDMSLRLEIWYFSPLRAVLFRGETTMQGFTEKTVGMMKSENLFASQGGPIILSQAFGTLPAFPGYGQPAPRHVRLLRTRLPVPHSYLVSKN
ncbi:hypothetical protein ACJX0J_017217, partial [Zea mays]